MILIEERLNLLISESVSIREALRQIDSNSEGILFVVKDDRTLLGTISDGDIRRSILAGSALVDSIDSIFNSKPFYVEHHKYDLEEIKNQMLQRRFRILPVIDGKRIVVGYLSWESVFGASPRPTRNLSVDLPVVIMAGGKGTRMAPFTNILPKPLIPVGDKTIVERIIDNFLQFGVRKYFITLNYRGEMIKAYFEGIERDYQIDYIWEKEFYGTAGCLSLAKDLIDGTFIVSNCDILVNADYSDVLDFHRNSKALLTVISSIQHIAVPYGVVEFGEGGEVVGLVEKPEFSYPINTGVYILEPECLDYIPEKTFFHMTHLIEKLIASGKKVVTYPVNEKDYQDVGQWTEYRKSLEALGE